jgi:uncharacterized membrane protein
MPNQLWAVASVLFASFLAALAAFLMKRGAAQTSFSPRRFSLSPRVIAAVGLYLLSSVFFFVALLGAQLSLVVPLTTTEYIWVVLLARVYLREEIGLGKAVGIAVIVAGVLLVGLGS